MSLPKSRFQRVKSRSLRLTSRDLDLLTLLFQHQVLTSGNLIRLGFFGSTARCNARLRILFDGGYVRRFFPEVGAYGAQACYVLGQKAVPLVAAELNLPVAEVAREARRTIGLANLPHTLAVTEFRLKLSELARSSGWQLNLWLTESACRHEYQIRVPGQTWQTRILKPDGFVRLVKGEERIHAFIEVDRGHVDSKRFRLKLESYCTYLSRGVFRDTYQAERFAVLVVSTGEQRTKALATLTPQEQAPDFLFTSAAEWVGAINLSDPIWIDSLNRRYSLLDGYRR